MTPRNVAVALAVCLAAAGVTLALLDMPAGRGGDDMRSVLFIVAGVALTAAGALSLFGDVPLRLPGRAMLRPGGRYPKRTDVPSMIQDPRDGEGDLGRGWQGRNVERAAHDADIPPVPWPRRKGRQ